MSVMHRIVQALWYQDFSALNNPEVLWMIYGIMFLILFLENGLLPAAFLPGDSLLLLAGTMVARGVMDLTTTMILMTIAASLGCWLGYLQGRWLGNTRLIKRWLLHLPAHYHQRARHLFHQHGMLALLTGRFLAFIRTLLPTLAGIAGLKNSRFQLYNWLSGFLWVGILIALGYAISQVPFIKRHEDLVMTVMVIMPFILLLIGLAGSIVLIFRNKKNTEL